jgi:hypothetical protein
MLFLAMLHPLKDKDWLKVLLFLLALFMGLIQSARIIQIGEPSDFPLYMFSFLEAGEYNLWDYVQGTSKEPFFRIINYSGFYLFNGNFVHFAALLVFVLYFSFYMAIYKFWEANYKDARLLIAAIVLFTFMTENIGMTNNLLRQQFAMGLMTYVIAQKAVDNKMNWWLAFLACFTHTLMFLFLPILFIKPLYKVIRLKSFIWITVILAGGILFLRMPFLSNLFSFSESLSYGFSRLENSSIDRDQTYMLGETIVYFYLVLFLIITLKLNYLDRPTSKSQIFFTNLQLFIMVLSAVLVVAPLIQTRFYITRSFIFPFVVPLLFHRNPSINRIYLWAIVIFFYSRFFISFDTIGGGMFFPPLSDLISGSILYFL